MTEVQPVAAELHRQRAGARIFQQAPRLGGDHLGLMQIPGRRPGQQGVIRQA